MSNRDIMRSLTKCYVFICVIMLGASACAGQGSGRSSGQTLTPSPQVSVGIPQTQQKKLGDAVVQYDSNLNETWAYTTLPLTDKKLNSLEVTVVVSASGSKLKRPDKVDFRFTNYDEDNFFKKNYQVTFVTEHGNFDLRNVENSIDKSDAGAEQHLKGDLELQVFEKIAGSTQVSVKVNKFTFELLPLHFKAFRDLLSTIEP
jgi:hypothetical protein